MTFGTETTGPHHALRKNPAPASADPMAEVLRIVQDLSRKIDRQDRELVEIKLRLERGSSSLEAAQKNGEEVRKFGDAVLVLQTRFAILWAGLGCAGGAAISGVVMSAFALLKH